MRRRIAYALIITLTLVYVMTSNVIAAEPNTMVYQGRLTDTTGAALTGTFSVTFSIYNVITGGTALWSNTESVTPDGNGVFTIELGPMDDSVFVGDKCYLGIKIGADPEMSPRQPLSSVPYSFRPVNIADGSITSSKIGIGAVGETNIQNGAVSGAKIKDNAITESKIVSGAIGTSEIATGAVGNTDLGADAVTTDKIKDATIASADLANASVTSNKIADNAISSTKIADGGVGGADIAGNAITGNKIADGTITAADIASNAVASAEIASGAVGNSELANNAVTAAKSLDEPGLTFKTSLPGNTYRTIPAGGATTALDSISINAPAAGYIYVMAHADIAIDHIAGTDDEIYFQVSNAKGVINFNNFGFAHIMVPGELPTQSGRWYTFPLDAHRPFTVSSSGTYKFYFNARIQYGSSDTDRFFDLQLTAFYFPTAYGSMSKASSVLPEDHSGKMTGE